MRERTMSDGPDAGTDDSRPDPDYSFEGFDVVFSRKVALMVSDPAPAAAPRKDGH